MIYALEIGPGNFTPAKFTNFSTLLNIILPLLILGALLVFLAMGLYGGFIWLTSGGSQESLAKAQKIFINAIIGIVIVIFAFVFVKIIGIILKVQTLP